MALFHEINDKQLTLTANQQHRCLYLDHATAPRFIVFDKTVKDTKVGALLAKMQREDAKGAQALALQRSKLHPCELTRTDKGFDLVFAAKVDTKAVVTRVKKLNSTIGGRLNVSVVEPQVREEPKELDLREEEPPEVKVEENPKEGEEAPPKVDTSGPQLDRIDQALEQWIEENGDPPLPGTPETALTALAKLIDASEKWVTKYSATASKENLKRGQGLVESTKVLRARAALAGKKGAYRPVDVTPILAWSWCSKNLKKGALLDLLKATLPAYEKAVKTLHRTPSQKTFEAAATKRDEVHKALKGAVAHYEKKQDATNKGLAEKLLTQARSQRSALATLEKGIGALDPEACKKAGAKVLSTEGENVATEVERLALLKEQELQTFLEASQENTEKLYNTITKSAEKVLERELVEAGTDEKLIEEAKKKFAANQKSANAMKLKGEEDREKAEQRGQQRIALRRGAGRLSWEWCQGALRPKSVVYKALEKVLPAYEKARKAMKDDLTPTTHAAAWKAANTLAKALEKALEANKQVVNKTGSTDADRLDEVTITCFQERVRLELKTLDTVEEQLPQGRLAEQLAGTPEGRSTLDAWVEDLGGTASTEDDKALVRTALKARFKVGRLDGDMTKKALPKLYKIFTMVPEGQTRDNDKLTRVERDRSVFVPDGYYSWDEDKKDGVIVMKMPRTGNSGLMKGVMGMILPHVEKPQGGWKDSGVRKSESKIIFSHLTLHEIGHAVDEQTQFMDSHLGDAKYGGWEKMSKDKVLKVAGEELGFFKALDGLGKVREPVEGEKEKDKPKPTIANDAGERVTFLTRYLSLAFDGSDPKKDDTLTRDAAGHAVDWKALASHKAVKFFKATKLNPGAMKQVTQWDTKAKEALAEGRVYQQSYNAEWWSYDASVRSRGIGGYQFRAPGEWFSEIYACYYGGRLKSSHPDYAWLKALIDNT